MIEFTHSEVPVGGVVSGRLVLRPGRSAPTGVTVAWLVWRTEQARFATLGAGEAIEDYVVVEHRRLEPASAGNAFEFRIPEQGPASYEGKLFRLVWEVVVGGQSPGPEPVACATFTVVAAASSAR